MKKIQLSIITLAVLMGVGGFMGCRKLDVPVESQYVNTNFPVTTSDYTALLGTMYANLASNYAITYWRMQELTTDEAIIPARDGNFDDGGQYRQMHYHTWNFDHVYVTGIWQWGFGGGITNCNRLIQVIASSKLNDSTKTAFTAEIRAMRALYYFFMMDTYGNVPIYTEYSVTTQPATQTRDKVFAFIETELKAVLPQLPAKTSNAATNKVEYGRPTKGMAYALLAKMYLNAGVYTSTPRWSDCVAMCDSVQTNPNYFLDARFRDIFLPSNGPQINETIFAVPYDQQIPGNQFTRFGFYYYLAPAYGMNVGLSIAMSTTHPFYNRFDLMGDARTKTWLVGPQFYPDGNGGFTSQPVYYPNTTTQIVINPDLTLVPPKPMDVGNTIASQAEGIRSIKYYPDPTIIQATRLNGNDVPVFRLADIYLEKAEAILRGAAATTVNGTLQTPDWLATQVRTRAGAPAASGMTLDSLLDERARELSWEGWRRNDLIRFGEYEIDYPFANDPLSMNKDPKRRLFPIPITELKLNTNLLQNDGYPSN
jgi:hypothetical protein